MAVTDALKTDCGYCRMMRRFGSLRWCKRHTKKATISSQRFYRQKEVDQIKQSLLEEIANKVEGKAIKNSFMAFRYSPNILVIRHKDVLDLLESLKEENG